MEQINLTNTVHIPNDCVQQSKDTTVTCVEISLSMLIKHYSTITETVERTV